MAKSKSASIVTPVLPVEVVHSEYNGIPMLKLSHKVGHYQPTEVNLSHKKAFMVMQHLDLVKELAAKYTPPTPKTEPVKVENVAPAKRRGRPRKTATA